MVACMYDKNKIFLLVCYAHASICMMEHMQFNVSEYMAWRLLNIHCSAAASANKKGIISARNKIRLNDVVSWGSR